MVGCGRERYHIRCLKFRAGIFSGLHDHGRGFEFMPMHRRQSAAQHPGVFVEFVTVISEIMQPKQSGHLSFEELRTAVRIKAHDARIKQQAGQAASPSVGWLDLNILW